MGVRGFLYMIKTVYQSSIVLPRDSDLLIIDGNCILHEVISEFMYLLNPELSQIVQSIVQRFKKIILDHKTESVIICFDGIPPLPKQLCQKRRRVDNFSISAFLLPKTRLTNTIESELIRYLKCDYVDIYSSHVAGEGEQKMIQILKKNPDKSVTLISYDSDVVILSLLQVSSRTSNVFVEVPSFNITIDIHRLFGKLEATGMIENLLWACMLCGNDFFPTFRRFKNMSTTDIFTIIKKGNLRDFEDLYFENKCSCGNENAQVYVSLFEWYKTYFSTNEFISADPYISEETPCVYCILKAGKGKLVDFSYNCSSEDHLKYVLTDRHKSNELL
jgi:hypothetical protein